MISNFSVKKPYTVIVGVVMVLLLGVISFMESTTDLLPEMELPVVVVYTTYPGASAEKVEAEVTRPIEAAVATTENLVNMSSTSSDNLSMIILEFVDDTNMDSAMINLNANIDMVEGILPDTSSAPNLMAINPNMMPIMMATVDVNGMDIQQLSDFVNDEIIPELEKTPGVASASASGLLEETVHITLSQEKIDAVNFQILNSIDSDLAEAEQELRDGLKEVNEGLDEITSAEEEMDSETDKAVGELADTSIALQQAATNLIAMDAQIIQLTAEQAAFKGIVAAYEEVNALPGGIDAMIDAQEGLATSIQSALTKLNTYVNDPANVDAASTSLPSDLSTEMNALALNVELALGGSSVSATLTTYGEAIAYFNEKLLVVQASSKQLQSLKAQYTDAVTRLSNLEVELATAEAVKDSASSMLVNNGIDVSDLNNLQSQLESGKITIGSELAVGQITLTNTKESLEATKKQLEDGLDDLEEAKVDALKAADISGILTTDMISGILQAGNFSMPAGYIASGDETILVKVGDVFTSLEQLNNLLILPLNIEGVNDVYLGDLAEISIANNSDEIFTRVNGNEAVMISFQKTSTSSTAVVTDEVHATFEKLMEEYEDLNYATLMDQGVYIDMIIASVLQNFMYGGILAVIVLMLFLKDIKPTIVIGISIPFSLMFTLVLMYFSDITLNIISLSGLALGVGMLVDNSVVVVENIYRMRSQGIGIIQASINGAKQVSGAIIASTLTTVCVFLPIVFTTGITRQLFVDMGLTIAYSLLASLIIALTLVPMLSSKILTKTPNENDGFFQNMVKVYESLLKWSLSHRFVVLFSSAILFVTSVVLAFNMGMVMIPEMASTQISLTAAMQNEEATMEETTVVMSALLEEFELIEGVNTAGVTIDSSGSSMLLMGGGSSSQATFYIITEDNASFDAIENQLQTIILKHPVDATISSNNMDMSALTGSGLVVNVYTDNLDDLHESARIIGEKLTQFEGIDEVSDGLEDPVHELRIVVDKNEAMEVGLTVAQVFQAVSEDIATETTSTTLTIDNKDYPVIVLKDESTWVNDHNLEELILEGTKDNETVDVKISDITKMEEGYGTQSVNRDNSRRYKSVSATIKDSHNVALVTRDVEENLDISDLPSGVTIEFSGENETIMETMNSLILMIGLAITFIYMIMVAQFQSLLYPFIVMFTIPLAFTGGLLALFLTNQDLSIISMLGFLVLSGVVVNNGIVFIDYVNQCINDDMDLHNALITAGKTRLRPILMTALTTILAMTTMALGIGEGSEMMQGMAIVTIGGLTYATILTLFVVPIIYSYFYRNRKVVNTGE